MPFRRDSLARRFACFFDCLTLRSTRLDLAAYKGEKEPPKRVIGERWVVEPLWAFSAIVTPALAHHGSQASISNPFGSADLKCSRRREEHPMRRHCLSRHDILLTQRSRNTVIL